MAESTILVPTDFSPSSIEALRQAIVLARQRHARLLIVHVIEHASAYAELGLAAYDTDARENELARMLSEVMPYDADVCYSQRLLYGEPVNRIVRCAAAERVELIVMGTHGRYGTSHLLMGSIAEKIVRRAPCPVLTVKVPTHSFAEMV